MKVLLVVIDAATPRVVCPAIQTGRLPVLQQLASAGTMHETSVTIFPSITPAATTSIVTGEYPAQTGITGASWYERETGEVAYYGDDFWTIAQGGLGKFLNDFLVRLNSDRLIAPTLFEMVEDAGLTAACLNYLVFKGRHPHRVNTPWLLRVLPGVSVPDTIHGPRVCLLGDFVASRTVRSRAARGTGGVLHRLGLDDATAGAMLCELVADDALPDVTVAYFPDNDFRGHETGPHGALSVVEQVDAYLGRAIDAAGGLERFLARTAVIVTSDHGHTEVLDDRDRAVVRLDAVLDEFSQATVGGGWEGEDILICPNMRAAQVYVREPTGALVRRLVHAALRHPGVDQALWHAPLTGGDEAEYVVATARGELRFRPTRAGGRARDAYGTDWHWEGDEGALGLARDGGEVVSADYPNAFERIANGIMTPRAGDLWLTARPGCEFEVPGGTAHTGGASHGSLHVLDSLTPVVAAGLPAPLRLPAAMRSVDLVPLCLELLGLPSRHAIGAPRPHPGLVRPSYVSRGA